MFQKHFYNFYLEEEYFENARKHVIWQKLWSHKTILKNNKYINALFLDPNAVPSTVINKQTKHAKSISSAFISDQWRI